MIPITSSPNPKETMMAQVYLSKEPCFQCNKTEKTVHFKQGITSIPLCIEHLYQHLTEKPKKEKDPSKTKTDKK